MSLVLWSQNTLNAWNESCASFHKHSFCGCTSLRKHTPSFNSLCAIPFENQFPTHTILLFSFQLIPQHQSLAGKFTSNPTHCRDTDAVFTRARRITWTLYTTNHFVLPSQTPSHVAVLVGGLAPRLKSGHEHGWYEAMISEKVENFYAAATSHKFECCSKKSSGLAFSFFVNIQGLIMPFCEWAVSWLLL